MPTLLPDVMRLKVTLPDGRTFPARVLAADTDHDLAALSIEAINLPTITPGESKQLQPGQWVLAVGHPWGVLGAATAGIVIDTGSAARNARNPGGVYSGRFATAARSLWRAVGRCPGPAGWYQHHDYRPGGRAGRAGSYCKSFSAPGTWISESGANYS